MSLKNEFLREEQAGASATFSKYHFKVYKKNNLFKCFLSFSSEEKIRYLISAHLFQIAETVKFNENTLLKMYHIADYQIKMYLFHI